MKTYNAQIFNKQLASDWKIVYNSETLDEPRNNNKKKI